MLLATLKEAAKYKQVPVFAKYGILMKLPYGNAGRTRLFNGRVDTWTQIGHFQF